MFNMDLEGNGSLDVPIDLKKKIKVVKLECDQHNHMQNWFYRVDSPYYAFSGDDGDFTIDKVPPGEYQLVAWHPKIMSRPGPAGPAKKIMSRPGPGRPCEKKSCLVPVPAGPAKKES